MTASIVVVSLLLTGLIQIVQLSDDTQQEDSSFRIDLVRVSRPASIDHIFNYQFASVAEPSPRKGDSSQAKRMNMMSYKSFSYIGEILVGQPAKMFRVLLDSGSADLWLPDKDCENIDRRIMATYDWTQSSSFQNDGRPIRIDYVNGVGISGRLARENFQFGDLSIRNQTFMLIDRASSMAGLRYYHMDGILGLSMQSLVDYPDVEPPIYSIMREAGRQLNGATKQILSLSLNHGTSDNRKAGQLILGGLDHSRYVGQITWTPLAHSKKWRFRVDSIELSFLDVDKQPILNELTVCPHGCEVTADTGTTLIAGNSRDIQMINERIGAYEISDGVFALPSCEGLDSRLPQLVVTISGTKFTLTPSQYTFRLESNCYSGFKKLKDKNIHWILGSIFLGHFYTVMDYDNHRFGLAESPFKSQDSIISH